MESLKDKYETVVGLEVHAQLLTKTKLFSGDSAAYGGEPNTHVSVVTLALPGTLPKLNRQAIEFAIQIGLACNCEIERVNYFARKHYFYPDLPKGYQITQHETPVCRNGVVTIKTNDGTRKIRLNHIHLEEDAGKSMHDKDDQYSNIDYNRAGVPLIEIVSEPDLRSGEEAYAFVTELRKLVRHLGICDGNMEEGSMRCDANISVRQKGDTKLGTKVEVKNLNSIRNVKRAIEGEAERMMQMMEKGERIKQETRSFNADDGTSFTLRTKEEADDYRYFTDPDLPPFLVSEEWINDIKNKMPELPEVIASRYMTQFALSEYDAMQLTDDKSTSEYFESLIQHTNQYKAAANWILGPVKSLLNESNLSIEKMRIPASSLAKIIDLVESRVINFSSASSRLLPVLMEQPDKDPGVLIKELNLSQVGDTEVVEEWVNAALMKMPDKVAEYKKGKKGLLGLFVGEVKKMSKGKADPKLVNDLLMEKLNQKV
jgi:aspartyl-tRNA(Asn)/glutamyl-tRNA(Gln) amidotransferase subunit B